MTWLSKYLGFMTARDREGICIDSSSCWQCPPPADPVAFVRALPALLPAGSKVCLEATSMSDDVRAFLEPRRASQIQEVMAGTVWPRAEFFHVDVTPENIEELALLFTNHATPEICDHFHAYGPAGFILSWYDAFSDPFFISDEIPEDRVKVFCDAIASKLMAFTQDIQRQTLPPNDTVA